MVVELPGDVLVLLCEELGHRLDFRTLFNCALAGKKLAIPALSWLYRSVESSVSLFVLSLKACRNHNQSTYFRDEYNAELSAKATTYEEGAVLYKAYFSKWALMWKSIIRSSLGNTAHPYCLYIRSLDFRNLNDLLADNQFRDSALEAFFADDMARFLKSQETPTKNKTRKGRALQMRLNVSSVLDLVGESITSYAGEAADRNRATVALEELSGNISKLALSKWASRLSRLKTITLYDGSVLNGEVATVINNHCPNFDDLTFLFCNGASVDSDMAAFLSTLRSNSIQSFTALSAQNIGPETLLALNNHSRSLKTLKLDGLKSDAIKNLSLLQGCQALNVLDLHDDEGLVDIEATENDIFLEVIAWLGHCTQLKELRFKKFRSAPNILTHLCLRDSTRLRKLEVVHYTLANNKEFHLAMSHQTSLESLILRAEAESDDSRDDIDTFVSSISSLTNLKELDIVDTADFFRSPEIIRIASSLLHLEKFSFSGYEGVTDTIWPSISGLRSLRALNVSAITSFTFDGILNYISTLQPSNQGLVLSVNSQDGDSNLSDAEKSTIQASISAKVGGSFEFELFREAESEFNSDSD